MASSLWTMISGDFSACPSVGKERNIHFSVFGHPSSYINHVMVFSVDILLMFTSLLAFIFKPSSAASQVPTVFHSSSSLQILSATFNGILGLAYLVLGFLILGENLKNARTIQPLLWWSVPLFHGCTWISLGLIISFKGRRLNKILASIFSLLASIFTVYLSVSSLFAVIFKHKQVSVEIVLYVLLLPGIILMLLSIFKATKKSESSQIVDETSLYTPLNSETDESKESSLDNNNVSPLGKAGLLSRLSFWWLNPLMVKGKEKTLQDEDIPHLPKLARAETCYLLFMEQLNKCTQNQPSNTASMLSVIVSCHWREILISGHFALLSVLMLCSGPLFLNAFIQVAQGNEAFRHEGYALAAGFFIAKCTESMSERQWYFRTRLIGVQIRSLLSAVIYQKQLRLSNAAKMAHSASDIMNYDAVDAYRIGEFPYWMHQTWTTIVQFCISLVILFRAVGLATISALVVVILSVIFNAPLAKLQHRHQKKLIEAQAERLKATSEALVNMKVLKLYAWENHWKNSIEELRKIEYKCLVSYMLRRASSIIIFWSTPMLVSAATFGTCCFLGIPLNASNVFTVLVTLRLVQEPIRIFPDVFEAAIHASVALSRILNFLEASELQVRPKCGEELNYSIFVKSANFSWENNNLKPTLRNINLETKPGERIAICGEVGSGKSTLLAGILGEVPNVDGRVYVHGEIAYVSQTAWIQTGTIQENVLFGSPMNEKRYQETIEKCALVKDLEMLPSGDLTEIGERGANLSGGQKQRIQLARALYQNADIYLLDDPFSAVDAHTAAYLFSEYVMGALSQKTVLLVTHQLDFLPPFDSVLLLLEGKILEVAPYHQLLASNKAFQGLVYAHHNRGGSKNLTEISSAQRETASEGEINRIHYKEQLKASEGDRLIMNEERETGDVGLKPYIEYLNQNKGFLYFLVMNLAHLIFTFGQILQNSWMAVKVQDPHFSGWRLVTVFFLIGCCSIFFLIFRSIFVVILGVQSSKSLFSQLLNSLIRAPMSFYDSTPLGRIYSRVSSDLSIVDLDIPFSLTFAVGAAITTYSNLGVLIVLTWQALLVIVFMIYVTILLQRYYQASAKELMRINGTSKSFVTNHLAESIAGATTIRAFKEEERFFTKYLDLVDNNASPYLHSFAANEWFIQRLEMLCAIVVSSSALVIVLLPPNTLGSGLIGMALSYGLSLNVFVVFYMQHQCRLSNYIISVERLAQYMHIPSEAPEVIESNRPFRSWPTLGRVEFYDLKVRYRPKAPLVLHGINCTFEGGQKIGIVGRTGSGKTTLISALFRLVEPTSGTVIIDGIDICTLGLHDLRSHLGIIPQDPTLFHGSVRYNLDPLSHHTDQEIWEVLAKCQLREIVQEKEEGLDSLVVEDGSNWSKGQRQLFALGRALLRRSRILVLDEATASVDNATDSILQKSVRTEFADCTVVMVAHRIPTVMDCTMVLSMSDGKLVEFDEPRKLMQKEGSLFRQLVREYWSHTTDFSVSSSSIT